MKLYEEFRDYEKLWDDVTEEDKKLSEDLDPADKVLMETDDFELEYEGFEAEWEKDHFDPGSWHGHYQTRGTQYYPSYTYDVDAISMFETIRDYMLPEYSSKYSNIKEVKEYNRLLKIWENSSEETEDEASAAVDLYLATNLSEFVDTFIEELTDHYAEAAHEWALDNLIPD